MRIKSTILVLIISIMLIPVWGLTFLDGETSSPISAFLGLVFTLYSYRVLLEHPRLKELSYIKLLFLTGPCIYLGAQILVVQSENLFSLSELLFSPILWGITILVAFMLTNRVNQVTVVIFLFSSYLYAFHLYPIYKRLSDVTDPEKTTASSTNLNSRTNILSYELLASGNKITHFALDDRPILVETWNEKCRPCINSITKLESFIEDSLNVNHILLYENFGTPNMSPDQVFSFNKIQDKTKIFIDPGGVLYRETGMKALPYFLLFDKKGNLVDYYSGFSDASEDELKQRLGKKVSELENESVSNL